MTEWTKKPSEGFPAKSDSDAVEPKPPLEAAAVAEAAAVDSPPSDDGPKEVALPSGWATESHTGPKRWGGDARSDTAEARVVHPPLASGIGDGKSVLFLFGLKMHSPRDQQFLRDIRAHIDDDVQVLRQAGYTVAVDEQATHDDFLKAVYGEGEGVEGLAPAALFWNAHGLADGSVETCDGGVVKPSDLDADRVAADLKLVIFASCYVGNRSRTWREALGGHPLVVGWGRPVTVDRAIEFMTPDEATETDLDDLIRRYLLVDTAVPTMEPSAYSPMADLSQGGQAGDLPERVQRVMEMLGGKWRAQEKAVEVDVPLGEGRWHRANVFLLDSAAPFTEGEPLLVVEADIGEITEVVDPEMLLSGVFGTDFARIALVESETDMPRMVAQGLLPPARVRDQDLAALIYHVCTAADIVEHRVFGGDMG